MIYTKAIRKEGIFIFIQNDDFSVTSVAFCFYKKIDSDFSLRTKERRHHGLTIVLSGSLTVTFDDQTLTVKKGESCIQKKGDNYLLTAGENGAEYIVTSYLCEPANFPDRLTFHGRVFCTDRSLRYSDALGKAADVYHYAEIYNAPLLRAIIQETLCHILRESESNTRLQIEAPAAAKQFIDANFSFPITVETVANEIGYSQSHLRLLFKNVYGESPNKYLNRVRIERAKEMLAADLFSLEEIAHSCGFRNVYYFSRVFKALTGVSPGHY